MQIQRKTAAAGIGALLAAGMVGGGIAIATQGGGPDGNPVTASSASTKAGSQAGITGELTTKLAASLGVSPSNVASALAQQSSTDPNFLDRLAQTLGIDAQKLRDAIKSTATEIVNEQEQAGTITSDVAGRLRDFIQSTDFGFLNNFPFLGKGGDHGAAEGRPGPGGLFGLRDATFTAVAQYLGISEDQLKSELAGGKTLAQVGEANGKSRDDLKQFLVTTGTANIDKDVTDGKITSTQGDDLKKNLPGVVDRVLDDTFKGTGGRGGGPHRGGADDDGQGSGATPAPTQRSSSPGSSRPTA